MMGMEHTRVNRLLGTLAHMGLAERTTQRKYRPGPGVHVLAAQSMRGSGMLRAALPVLQELRVDEATVGLGVFWLGQICFLYHARPWHAFEDGIGRHELWPAHKSSAGRVLLAHRPASETRNGPVPRAELTEVVKQGHSIIHFPNGQVSIGVPIGSPPVAALATSSEVFVGKRIPLQIEKLQQAAAKILTRMEKPEPADPSPTSSQAQAI